MAFEERLKELRVGKLEKIKEIRTQQEKKEMEKKEKEEKMQAELKKLEEIATTQLSPILELVNEVYIEREGVVSSEGFLSDPGPTVRLELSWRSEEPSEIFVSGQNNKLILNLGHTLDVILFGAGCKSPRLAFSLNDEKWQQKLEEGIYSILNIPSACMWIEVERDRGD